MANPILGKESATFAKWKQANAEAEANYKAWEDAEWKKNEATYKAQGYTRTPDSKSSWGSSWSFKAPVNNSKDVSKVAENPSDAVKAASESAKALGVTPVSENINGKSHSVAPDVLEDPLEMSPTTPFKYRKGANSYYMLNSAMLDFAKIFLESNGRAYQYNNAEDRKEFDSWINQYYREAGRSNPFRNYYESNTTPVATNLSFLDAHKRNNPGMYKQGGTMNKVKYFQQGGTAQQDIQKQIVALVQAVMSGDKKATQTVNQIMEAAKKGDQQATQLAQMIQAVAQQMQGKATAAKWGTKLQYIKSLKYAKGGKTCPACMEGGGSTKVAKKDIDKATYQKLSPAKKQEADEHYLGTATSTNKDGSYNISHKPSASDSTHIDRKHLSPAMKKKYPEKKKCGGMAKKHYFGGWL